LTCINSRRSGDIPRVYEVTFAAVAIDRIPKYGPEETNIATLVDKHTRLESAVAEIACKMESFDNVIPNRAQATELANMDTNIKCLGDKIHESSDDISSRLSQLTNICSKLAESVRTSATVANERSTSDVDRTRNIVISGVDENRDRNVWMATVQRVLHIAADRDIPIVDAFRIGGRFSAGRKRPILVKLQSVWDRRVVVGGSRKLAGDASFRGQVYINADESVETRRQNTLIRLKSKAEREGKTVAVTGDTLFVNNVPIFCVRQGYIRNDGINNVNHD
jgi:hypothetical protein